MIYPKKSLTIKAFNILLLLVPFILFAQLDSTKVSFISYWDKGDSYNFKISKIKKQWKNDTLTKDTKNQYIASFTVIDSTATSYKISWKYENDLENTYKIDKKFIDKLSKYKVTEIIYETNEVGEFKGILNWKELSKTMSNMIDDIVDILSIETPENKPKIKEAMSPFKKIYSSKQGIEQLVLKELQYFHMPLGYEYERLKPLEYIDELPNMFGGKPIKGKAKMYFTDVNYDDGFCVFKKEMELDEKDTKELLKQVFSIIKPLNKKLDLNNFIKKGKFNIKDVDVYEYYFNPGVPHKIETTRQTIMDFVNETGKRIDKTIIELQYNQ